MEELLKVLTPLGIGGILAGFMFWFYRQDRLGCKDREKMIIDVMENTAETQQKIASGIDNMTMMLSRIMDTHDRDIHMFIEQIMKGRKNDS